MTATALEENTEAPVLAVEMGGVQVITNDAGVVAAGALGDGGLTAIVGGYGPLRSATLHLNYHNDEEEGTEARAEESELMVGLPGLGHFHLRATRTPGGRRSAAGRRWQSW